MTIENLFVNLKIVRAENYEKHGNKFNYAYDRNSEMFEYLQEAVVVNTAAKFSSSMSEKY